VGRSLCGGGWDAFAVQGSTFLVACSGKLCDRQIEDPDPQKNKQPDRRAKGRIPSKDIFELRGDQEIGGTRSKQRFIREKIGEGPNELQGGHIRQWADFHGRRKELGKGQGDCRDRADQKLVLNLQKKRSRLSAAQSRRGEGDNTDRRDAYELPERANSPNEFGSSKAPVSYHTGQRCHGYGPTIRSDIIRARHTQPQKTRTVAWGPHGAFGGIGINTLKSWRAAESAAPGQITKLRQEKDQRHWALLAFIT